MLVGLRHWHLASKRSPEREGRLLAFANGNTAGGQPGGQTGTEAAQTPETQTPATPEAVEGIAGTTREKARGVLADEEGAEGQQQDTAAEKTFTLESVLTHVMGTMQKLRDIDKNMKSVDGKAQRLLDSGQYKKFQQDRRFIQNGMRKFELMQNVLGVLQGWNRLEVLPSELRVALETFGAGSVEFGEKTEWHKHMKKAHEALTPKFTGKGDMNKLGYAHLSKSLHTSSINASTSITAEQEARRIVDEYSQAIDLPRILHTLLDYLEEETLTMDQCLEKADTVNVIKQVSDAPENTDTDVSGTGKGVVQAVKDLIPVQLISIADAIEAGKQMIEAYKEAWEQRRRLRSSAAAHKLSKFVKHFYLGEDVEQTLKRNIESKNNEMKESYMNYLKSSDATFAELFEPGGIYDSNQGDYNRFRAVIEYAASKGWLYELDGENAVVMGKTLEVGRNLPPETNLKQYLRFLNEQNGNGEDNEVNRGKSLVGTDEKIPPILVALREQMQLQNYWAVKGICEVALNKAKSGQTSSWLAVTIYRELRNDPMARRYVSKRLYDQIKNLVLPMPMMGVAVVMDRDPLEAWQRANKENADAERNLERAGVGGETIAKIEHDILEQQRLSGNPPLNTIDLDELVARVMSAQVIKKPGWKKAISIFDDKYKNYRNFAQNFDAENAGNADPDYYDPTLGSEILILGRKAVLNILSIKSTRDFDLGTRAYNYLSQVCVRHDQLEALLPGSKELETYREHVQNNMAAVFLEKFDINDTAQLANMKISIPLLNPDGTIGGETTGDQYAFVEFYKRGLLTKQFLVQAHKDGGAGLKKLIESIFNRAEGQLPGEIAQSKKAAA